MRIERVLVLMLISLTGVAVATGAPVANICVDSQEDSTSVSVNSILALIRMVKDDEGVNQSDTIRKVSELDVLNYFSAIYEENDYYESGDWGIATDIALPTLYSGALPRYAARQFHRPVVGRITSAFGLRPGLGRMHKGIDLALAVGDSVRVALDGVVERTGFDKNGFGQFVVVAHPDGLQTIYAHLQRPLKMAGDKVRAGDIIGLGGKSGNSTGPHLHFEIRFWGSIVDPTYLIGS